MSDHFREQIAGALQALVIFSPTTYSWFGNQSPRLPPFVKRALNHQTIRDYLLFSVQSHLYANFYCQGFAAPARRETMGLSVMGMTPFVQELSAANSGSGYWEESWEVRAIGDGVITVRRGGLELWVRSRGLFSSPGRLDYARHAVEPAFPKGISRDFTWVLYGTERQGALPERFRKIWYDFIGILRLLVRFASCEVPPRC